MKLIKCKKCGTVISSSDTFLEQMMLAMDEYTKKAIKAKSTDKILYIQLASQVKSMIKQVQHLTSQIEIRKITVQCEMSEIIHYLRNNKLITDSKLDKLRQIARNKAEIKNKQDEADINKVYGNFENVFTNKTKSDKTASEAIRNL